MCNELFALVNPADESPACSITAFGLTPLKGISRFSCKCVKVEFDRSHSLFKENRKPVQIRTLPFHWLGFEQKFILWMHKQFAIFVN